MVGLVQPSGVLAAGLKAKQAHVLAAKWSEQARGDSAMASNVPKTCHVLSRERGSRQSFYLMYIYI